MMLITADCFLAPYGEWRTPTRLYSSSSGAAHYESLKVADRWRRCARYATARSASMARARSSGAADAAAIEER